MDFFNKLKLSKKEQEISQKSFIKEITSRLQFMLNVGIENISRSIAKPTRSQAGRSATHPPCFATRARELVGTLYVLDEPTIGLHQRDNDKLIETLKRLRDLGNTVVVVEHDEDTIYASDYIVDIGPGAGVHGGNIARFRLA